MARLRASERAFFLPRRDSYLRNANRDNVVQSTSHLPVFRNPVVARIAVDLVGSVVTSPEDPSTEILKRESRRVTVECYLLPINSNDRLLARIVCVPNRLHFCAPEIYEKYEIENLAGQRDIDAIVKAFETMKRGAS